MSTVLHTKSTDEGEEERLAEQIKTSHAPSSDFSVVYPVQPHSANGANIQGQYAYKKLYDASLKDPQFWGTQANKFLKWDSAFSCIQTGRFEDGDVNWFAGGKLNASVQCLDRHVWNPSTADTPAVIWEGDEPGTGQTYTFREALREVCRIANVLKSFGVREGDCVTIYLPMIPQVVFAMLACARLGAPHSVVFAGFSSEALRDRIVDCKSKFCIVADEGMRGGRPIALKKIMDDALLDPRCAFVERVFMFKRTGNPQVQVKEGRDMWMDQALLEKYPAYCPPVSVDSEHPLFYLYTSGSTGKPKGLLHTTAGYLLYVSMTHKYVFDVRPRDVYACVADAGWITGHSYIVYGPLSNGCGTLIFESTPLYPDAGRYWDLVETHKITQFYTAPTAIRALMKFGDEPLQGRDLSSLRVLGTVGEPINPSAWKWYYEKVGSSRCAIVDTFWQTETGGIVCTPLPGVTPMKPGSCCQPFFGIEPVLLDPTTGVELAAVAGEEQHGVLAIKRPWPSMTRTINGDHDRYLKTYFVPYPGTYFTGDGAMRDGDGYLWITGRVDDVLNVSGHRVGSAELESALNTHASVAESAVVGFPHDVKGEGIAAYVILKQGVAETGELLAQIKLQVRNKVGAFAGPDFVIVCPTGLPKTRSGKIMRRVLRKIVAKEHESLGDISTLADPSVVEVLILKVADLTKA